MEKEKTKYAQDVWLEKLNAREPIFATKSGNTCMDDSDIIEITKYSLLKGNKGPYDYSIYYEWGEEFIDYNLYQLDDCFLTWSFDKDDLVGTREEFFTSLYTLSPLQKFRLMTSDATDVRLKKHYSKSLEEDLERECGFSLSGDGEAHEN